MPDITIPCPLLVTVDDVGWWLGRDGSAENQPFRTGMPRRHVPEDYQALAALGRALDMRIPAGIVLCEWDGGSLLRNLPSATWMGDKWQVPFNDQAQKEAAVSILKEAVSFIEPAVHGLGHEFWINGKLSRSEFHTSEGKMRHPDEVKKHLEYFFRLMAQNNLDTGVRLFIPPALNHSFGNGAAGFQKIAADFGIQYVTPSFEKARCYTQPQYGNVGWENRVVLMDRESSPIAWDRTAPEPAFNLDQPILPLHWANILHKDPKKNMDAVNAWVKFIDQQLKENNMVPSRDIAQHLTQFLNHTRSKVRHEAGRTIVDMDWINEVPSAALSESVFFLVKQTPGYELKILGAEKSTNATSLQANFLKLKVPKSGRIVFELKPLQKI